ncbi:MAG: response regulator transcription factor [Chloroflexus sp.]|nr:response regulator transcription factor [Chloroflexus sp.]
MSTLVYSQTANPVVAVPHHETASTSSSPLHLAIADYSEVVRRGLQALLHDQPAIRIAAVVDCSDTLLNVLETQSIEVALIDLGEDDQDRLRLINQVHRFAPRTRLILFNSHLTLYHILELVQAGVAGIVPKHAALPQILLALHKVRAGRLVLQTDTFTYGSLVQTMVAPGVSHDAQLLPRDLEVLQQLVAGATNKEIAALLHLSSKTVEVRVAQICTKLGVRSRTEAAVKAVSLGLVRPPPFTRLLNS